jgi:rare lipoprotein A (peptidoglycan hydrolase)
MTVGARLHRVAHGPKGAPECATVLRCHLCRLENADTNRRGSPSDRDARQGMACHAPAPPATVPPAVRRERLNVFAFHPRGVIVGKASFYAYAGGKTASGKPYHRGELTAASRNLPFGTRLRVTDLKTNKSVGVTVTDRGPASSRLILDLSLGAAQQLGITSRGIIQVRAKIVS